MSDSNDNLTEEKTLFSHAGNTVSVVRINPKSMTEKLQPGVYSVHNSPMAGYFLNFVKHEFDVPNKIFGNYSTKADKVIHSYQDRPEPTGVLFTGVKGAGKTMLVEIICNRLMQNNVPVIMVGDEFHGDEFTNFINDIGECCLVFDEVAKVYKKHQDALLSLMDGVFNTKRLVLMTENNPRDINEFLLSRPGRILYHFEYNRVDDQFIDEYCEFHKVPESVTADIHKVAQYIDGFSVDMVKAIVDEYNRFGGTVKELVTDMNIQVTSSVFLYTFKTLRHGEFIYTMEDFADGEVPYHDEKDHDFHVVVYRKDEDELSDSMENPTHGDVDEDEDEDASELGESLLKSVREMTEIASSGGTTGVMASVPKKKRRKMWCYFTRRDFFMESNGVTTYKNREGHVAEFTKSFNNNVWADF